jgi:hypothetical protein
MAASKNLFNKERERMLLDERETENYPPFDHHENFCKKVKENWLSTEKLTELTNCTDPMVLTQALIDYKMQPEDMTIIMAHLDLYEPKSIKGSEYIEIVCKSHLENMKRVLKKYTQDDTYYMRKVASIYLESEIKKKENQKNDCGDCNNYAEYDGGLKYCSVCGKKLN